MHYTKFGKASSGPVLEHCERGIGKKDTHHHSNENIDPTRTYLNYDIHERHGLTAYQFYQKRLNEIEKSTKERTGKSVRKDAVTLCSWVITAPKDLPENELERFFDHTYLFYLERYGIQNIVAATVHMDEVTPHMHFLFMPVQKNKDGYERLCAKNLETRQTLQQAHIQLQKSLEETLKHEVNLLNGATAGGNKTILELKNKNLQEQCEELEKRRDDVTAWVLDQKDVTASATKEVKGFLGKTKTVPKTEKELETDKHLIFAQLAHQDLERRKKAMQLKEEELQKRYDEQFQKLQNDFKEAVNAKAREYSINYARKEINKVTAEKDKEINKLKNDIEAKSYIIDSAVHAYMQAADKSWSEAEKEIREHAYAQYKIDKEQEKQEALRKQQENNLENDHYFGRGGR